MRVMRMFLWVAIFGWGIGLGAKLFDLIVVAGAWSASPPASFALLPYGKQYPIDPGDFFIPLSALIAIGSIGALISGRKQSAIRLWLWLGVISFLIIWLLTPTVFWPMIDQLYYTATGKISATNQESIALAHRWLIWDWIRVGLIAAGFIASVRALSYQTATNRGTTDAPRIG
jgi:hypothetical protein